MAILLVLAFALRVPSFHPQFLETDESFYLTAAEKIVDGGIQYVDTWDNKPPMLIWVYSFFSWIFGDFALMAIRVFTCLYLFLGALLLNRIAINHKLLQEFTLLPGFLFLFLCSIPWYTQELNGEILMSVPIILAAGQVMRLKERHEGNQAHLFLAGLLIGVSFMIKYQAIFIFLGLGAAYLAAQPPRLEEVFSYIAGFVLTILIFITTLYFTGALAAFWDIGIVYNLDYIFVGKNPSEKPDVGFNILQYLQLWGVFMFAAAAGIFYFRANYFVHSIRLRKVELILLLWFAMAFMTILVGFSRMYLHYFYLLVPPLSIYAAKFFEFNLRKAVQTGILALGLLVPFYTYGVWMVSAFPKTFSFVDPYLTPGGWISNFRKQLNEEDPLKAHIDQDKIKNGVLVLDYDPKIYQSLNVPSATKFTNFSMAYYKFSIFPWSTEHKLLSHKLKAAEIYRSFEDDLPEYIIDPADMSLFPKLSEKMPLLFAGYTADTVQGWNRTYVVYYLEKPGAISNFGAK